MIRMNGSVKRNYYERGPGCESPTIYGIRGGVKSGDTILGRGGDKRGRRFGPCKCIPSAALVVPNIMNCAPGKSFSALCIP
jgi:hypothetical protein